MEKHGITTKYADDLAELNKMAGRMGIAGKEEKKKPPQRDSSDSSIEPLPRPPQFL